MTTSTPGTVVSGEPAGRLRQAMVDHLKQAYPRQLSAGIEQALRVVPRHLFCPPGTTLEAAYANGVVLTRHDATGRATSSVSAPCLVDRTTGVSSRQRVMAALTLMPSGPTSRSGIDGTGCRW